MCENWVLLAPAHGVAHQLTWLHDTLLCVLINSNRHEGGSNNNHQEQSNNVFTTVVVYSPLVID